MIDCQPLQHEVAGLFRFGINFLNEIINENKINTNRVALSLPSDACYTRLIEIPEEVEEKDEDIKDLKAYALHNKKYTYIEWWDTVSNTIVNQELYDIEEGLETINIISDPSRKETVKKLSKKIEIKNQSLK